MRSSTPFIRDLAGEILRLLQIGPCTLTEIRSHTGVSSTSIHRAIWWLRDCDVPVVFSRRSMMWEVGMVESLSGWTLRDLVKAGAMGEGEALAMATVASLSRGHRRVTCPTTERSLRAKTKGRRWTPSEDRRARELESAGLTYDEVGRVLGRTGQAVRNRILRTKPRALRVVGGGR